MWMITFRSWKYSLKGAKYLRCTSSPSEAQTSSKFCHETGPPETYFIPSVNQSHQALPAPRQNSLYIALSDPSKLKYCHDNAAWVGAQGAGVHCRRLGAEGVLGQIHRHVRLKQYVFSVFYLSALASSMLSPCILNTWTGYKAPASMGQCVRLYVCMGEWEMVAQEYAQLPVFLF